MATWFWYAVATAVLYGAHQLFTQLASDHVGEGIGGFVVEVTDALSIVLYLLFLWLTSRWDGAKRAWLTIPLSRHERRSARVRFICNQRGS